MVSLNTLKNKYSVVLAIAFIILFSATAYSQVIAADLDPHSGKEKPKLVLFYSDTCPHCHAERLWLETIKPNYPDLIIEGYEAGDNKELSEKYCKDYNTTCGAVPRTFISGKVFIGFDESEGDLVYHEGYKAYIGYSNQIEKAIQECVQESCGLNSIDTAIEASKKEAIVNELLLKNPNSVSTAKKINGTYVVAWWTPGRISSNLGYPDIAVYIDSLNSEVLKSEVPTQPITGIDKPHQDNLFIIILILGFIAAYLIAYLLLNRRASIDSRYWTAGFITVLIAGAYIYFTSMPPGVIQKFAKGFPFPVFVFIIALADGFNPCAFTVLAVLLSLLTHTNSRKKMALIGTVFILTSALMYFIFIMAINFFGSWMFSQWGKILFMFLGFLVFVAGLINLKDYFFFKQGFSLTIPDNLREKIFRHAGKIVKKVDKAEDKRTLFAALLGTALLATLVNVVELGCTAMFPMAYTSALISNYGKELGFYHVAYTLFYSLVYVIPLFAILGDFLYTFKSDRVTEGQARILKLVGGLMMIGLGAILMFNPELLTLLR